MASSAYFVRRPILVRWKEQHRNPRRTKSCRSSRGRRKAETAGGESADDRARHSTRLLFRPRGRGSEAEDSVRWTCSGFNYCRRSFGGRTEQYRTSEWNSVSVLVQRGCVAPTAELIWEQSNPSTPFLS